MVRADRRRARISGDKRRLLILAPSFAPAVRAGGPARTLTNLVRELNSEFVVDVVTPDRDLGDSEPFVGLSGRQVTRGGSTVYYLDSSSPAQVHSLLRRLAANRYDLIMVNSIWNYRYALIPVLLRSLHALRGPVLLLPHGELESGALALKSGKKSLAGPMFRAVYRHGVSLFGATSDAEVTNINGWFPTKPVVSTRNNHPDAIPWGEPATSSPRLRALFLSRIHPTKGLLPLLQGLRQAIGDIHLSIIGPTEDPRYWQQCQGVIAQMPAHITVTHTGLARRDEVPALLWNSDCMILLTAGENYGHVFAEALQAGCPVITTPATPWTNVVAAGGGTIIDQPDDPTAVAATMDAWAAMNSPQLAAARVEARKAFDAFAAAAGPNIVELSLEVLASR